jgi:hypothetical protein
MTQEERGSKEPPTGCCHVEGETVCDEKLREKKKEEPPIDKAAERLKQFEEARRPQVPEEEAEGKEK